MGKARAINTGDATVLFNGSVVTSVPVTIARVHEIQVRVSLSLSLSSCVSLAFGVWVFVIVSERVSV